MQIAFKLERVFARPFREDSQLAAAKLFRRVARCGILGDAEFQMFTLGANLLVKVS